MLCENDHCHVSYSFIDIVHGTNSVCKVLPGVQRIYFSDPKMFGLMWGEGVARYLGQQDTLRGPLEANLPCVIINCANSCGPELHTRHHQPLLTFKTWYSVTSSCARKGYGEVRHRNMTLSNSVP